MPKAANSNSIKYSRRERPKSLEANTRELHFRPPPKLLAFSARALRTRAVSAMVGLSLSSVLRTFCAGAGALQLPIPALSSRRAVLGGLGGLAAAVLAPPSAHAVTGEKMLPDALEDLPRNAKKARTYLRPAHWPPTRARALSVHCT